MVIAVSESTSRARALSMRAFIELSSLYFKLHKMDAFVAPHDVGAGCLSISSLNRDH